MTLDPYIVPEHKDFTKKLKGEFGMGKLLKKCVACHQYSLTKEICPNCGGHLRIAAPPKFSPQDKYGKYRRMLLKTTLTLHQKEE